MNEAVKLIETKEKYKYKVESESLLSFKTKVYLPFKRLLDIFFGIIGIILTIPFFIIIKISYLINGDKNE